MQIAFAMRPDLIERFFDAETLTRLAAVGPVARIAFDDLTGVDARRVLADTEVLITGWGSGRVDADVLRAAPRLRAVVHSGGSVRAVVSPECYARGLVVTGQADHNALPVAEYTLAMVLLAAKRVFTTQRVYRQHRGPVDQRALVDGAGNHRSRVGLVGASKIGTRVIELLSPFDHEVCVYDPFLDADRAAALGVRRVSLEELMSTCPVVSLHAPMLPATHHLIDAEALARMPDGATLINTARPGVVDEQALLAELVSGRIEAVLDVTDLDLDPDSPIWTLPNVILTPHVAGALGNELGRLGRGVVADVEELAATGTVGDAISAEEYERLA